MFQIPVNRRNEPMNSRFWSSLALRAGGIAVLLQVGVRMFERANLYHPSSAIRQTPADAGLAHEDVRITAEDGVRTQAWWIPRADARGTLIAFHGNAETIGDLVRVASVWNARGAQVLLAEYRGYGNSEGRPSEQGFYRDARAAFDFVRDRDGDRPRPIIVYGRSLGAAVAARLAVDRPVDGVVMESGFASTRHMARALFPGLPVGWLLRERYEVISLMPRIRAPVLIAHSPDDEMVPLEQAQLNYEAATAPKRFIPLAGGHNDGFTPAHRKFEEEQDRFAGEIFGP